MAISPVISPVSRLVTTTVPEVTPVAAAGVTVEVREAGRPAPPPRPSAQPATPEQALRLAKADAAIRQAGIARTMADLETALATPGLPARLRAAIEDVLSLRTPLSPNLTAADLRQAVSQSGLFLEARLADPARAGRVKPKTDFKAALLVLGEILRETSGRADAPTAASPPPHRGATHAEAPTGASFLPGTGSETVLPQLKADVGAAIARQTLLQTASAPEAAAAPPAWMFEIPFQTPAGAAVAQFEVEREPARAGQESPPSFHVRFSVDAEPMGAVHAELAMGRATHVTLFAEREETARRLTLRASELAGALGGDTQVLVRRGAPASPDAPAGQFVDRAL